MKSKETMDSAVEMFINNIPIYKIARQLHISKNQLQLWKKQYDWAGLRSKAIQKQAENITNDIINEQTRITKLANKLVFRYLKQIRNNGPLDKDSVANLQIITKIMQHGLNVVRPTQPQFNFMKQENSLTQIKVNIPEGVRELLEGLNGVQSKRQDL